MTRLGYALSSEEHTPNDLVRNARAAEEAGFTFALISDHFHPWVDAQGHSPFVWSVIGAIAHQTERLELGTGVTCPLIRTHPAIVAHAAATCAAMMPGRFFLGIGTGENLNEHVVGHGWPAPDERVDMLEEAVELMRQLWQGGYQTFRGAYYSAENARLYTLPAQPVRLAIAANQQRAAELAGREGDAFVGVNPDSEVIGWFDGAGGEGKPRYGQVTVCWAEDEAEARRTAHRVWPNAGIPGELSQELPLPRHFEQAAENVSEDDVAETVVCGNDVDRYVEAIGEFEQAGYDHVYLHQVGSDQAGFIDFAKRELLPRYSS
jgi:G6PDH family F420-dependent oxidoreductase